MSLKATFALMWVLILLIGLYFTNELYWKPKREKATDRESRVVWIEGKKIERLEITSGSTRIILTCAEEAGCAPDGSARWRVFAPVEDVGDSSAIGSLASAVLNLKYQDKLDLGGVPSLREFGLEGPAVEVSLKGGETFKLQTGNASAIGPNVYLLHSPEPHRVYLVASFFQQMLMKDLFHWRNKRLFPGVETESVNSLAWSGKLSVAAEKQDGTWRLVQPVATDADSIRFEGLVSTLVYAEAASVYRDSRTSPEAVALLKKRPVMDIRFRAGEKPQHLSLYPLPTSKDGKGGKEYVAAVEGLAPLFLISATQFDRFEKPLLEYRARRLVKGLTRNAVNEIKLRFPREKNEITLTRKGDTWTGTPVDDILSRERIEAFLSALVEAEAHAFLPAGSQGARLLARGPNDVEVELKGPNWPTTKLRFLVMERKSALTDGPVAGEVRTYGEDLLRPLPIRLTDLYEINNQQVVVPPASAKEGPQDGHDHAGHQH